ncbi:unnamed protein product [Amaranthus hypochondriacus]
MKYKSNILALVLVLFSVLVALSIAIRLPNEDINYIEEKGGLKLLGFENLKNQGDDDRAYRAYLRCLEICEEVAPRPVCARKCVGSRRRNAHLELQEQHPECQKRCRKTETGYECEMWCYEQIPAQKK